MKKHSAAWWIFVSWWWYPYKWLFYSLPRFIIKHVKKARKINAQPFQDPQAITPLSETQTPKNEPTKAPTGKVETHKVAGISHYSDAVEALGVYNDDYDLSKRELIEEGRTAERIYRTNYFVSRVELVPEPDNPYDSNAVKVICDGQHIGYIKAGSCSHVLRLLRENLIKAIEVEVVGGPYKILLEDYEDDTDNVDYTDDEGDVEEAQDEDDVEEAQDEDDEPVYKIEEDDVPHHAKLRIATK